MKVFSNEGDGQGHKCSSCLFFSRWLRNNAIHFIKFALEISGTMESAALFVSHDSSYGHFGKVHTKQLFLLTPMLIKLTSLKTTTTTSFFCLFFKLFYKKKIRFWLYRKKIKLLPANCASFYFCKTYLSHCYKVHLW